jgi:hypothetical protein
MGSIDQALADINAFEAEPFSGVAWQLSRTEVLARLRQLVLDPSLLDQRGLNACAPAVFFRAWFARDPAAASAFACALLRDGSALIGALMVAPSSKLRAQQYALLRSTIDAAHPNSTPECTDWMLLSGLRDSENIWFDYLGEPFSAGDAVAGLTLPGTLAGWLTATNLYSSVSNATNLVASGDPHPLLDAIPTSDRDIILFINVAAIFDLHAQPGDAPPASSFFVVPNHYVLMTGPFALSEDASWTQVDVWSWGSASRYRGWQGTLRLGSNYFGLVEAVV